MLGPYKSLRDAYNRGVAVDGAAERIGQDLVRLVRLVARMPASGPAAHVLGLLVERGPQRVGEIAAVLGTDPSTASRKVAALVEEGLVERTPDPDDGRAHLLAATEAGTRQWAAGRRHRIDRVTAALAGWPDDAREHLAAQLRGLVDGLQEQEERADVRRRTPDPGGTRVR